MVSRGVASRGGVVKTAGTFWGEDFILENWDLKEHIDARALTYVEILILNRESFFDCMENFSEETKVVRKAAVRLAIHRGILKFARAMRDQGLVGAHMMSKANIHLDDSDLAGQKNEVSLRRISHLGQSSTSLIGGSTHTSSGLNALQHFEEHEFNKLERNVAIVNQRLGEFEGIMEEKFDTILDLLRGARGGRASMKNIDDIVQRSMSPK